MRILILGDNHAACRFCELFSKDKNNIVFSVLKGAKSFVELASIEDIIDFCAANVINFVLITENKYLKYNLAENLAEFNTSVFAPTNEASLITVSKVQAKRFMYKNKIPTPKFNIVEKTTVASDYIKQAGLPLVIKPDNSNFKECPIFVETNKQAQSAVETLFNNGNSKIIIEDYILGKNLTLWTISDGFSAKIIGSSAKYQNNVAYFEPDFLTYELKEKITDKIINPTISALSACGNEYTGILGFDVMIDRSNNPYLVNYNSFFDDMSVDFFTQYNLNWLEVFESTLVGDVFSRFNFETPVNLMLTLRFGDEIELISAKTKSALKTYLSEMEYDLKDYCEAKNLWKY